MVRPTEFESVTPAFGANSIAAHAQRFDFGVIDYNRGRLIRINMLRKNLRAQSVTIYTACFNANSGTVTVGDQNILDYC